MNYPYLTGKTVYLRAMEQDDLEIVTCINNESNVRIMGDDDAPYPLSMKDLETFNDQNNEGKNFVIVSVIDKKIIGSLAIYAVNHQNLNCELSIVLSEPFQGKGYGREAMDIIIEFIFHYLPMNKIKVQVFSFNSNAISLYKSLGFEHEGTLKEEIFRFSKFQDLENYALFREKWQK